MPASQVTPPGLKPAILAFLVVLVAAGCASTNLGDIDDTLSERDDMPGPGIFADEDGETTLKWVVDAKNSGEAPATEVATAQASNAVESEQAEAVPMPAPAPTMDEKAEFEAFKEWNRLRTEGVDSPEYQEFQLWLKYQQFKN